MPYLKDGEFIAIKTWLQAILDCQSIDDVHKIADRDLEFMKKLEKEKKEE